MDKNVVFKTATVGGFEKRAVLDYIYKMNEEMEQERTELLRRIEEMQSGDVSGDDDAVIQKLNTQLSKLERELAEKANQLSEEQLRNNDLIAKNKSLMEQIEKLKIEKESFVDSDRIRELEAKQEEIEKSSYQIGRVMLDARTDAEMIVEGSKKQAEKIVQQAEQRATELKLNVESEASKLLSSAQENAKKELDNARNEHDRIIAEANSNAKNIKEIATKESESVLDNAKTRLAEIVKTSTNTTASSNANLTQVENNLSKVMAVLEDSFNEIKKQSQAIQNLIIETKVKINDEEKNINAIDSTNLSMSFVKKIQSEENSHDEEPAILNDKQEPQMVEVEEELPSTIIGDDEVEEVVGEEVEIQEGFTPVFEKPIPVFDVETVTDEEPEVAEVGVESGLLDRSVTDN